MAIVKKIITNYRIFALFILLFIFMSIANPFFFSMNNMWGLFVAMPAYGIAAIGLTFVLIAGKLDISLGSVMALTSVFFAMLLPKVGFVSAALITLLSGMALGTITGSLVAFLNLDTFIISLSAMIAYKGVALFITNARPIVVSDQTVQLIGNTNVFGCIPITFFIFIFVALAAQWVLSKTQFGRNIFAIGGNLKVAKSVGINIKMHVLAVFVINAALASLGGIIMMARVCSASGNLALDGPLTIIPIIIIGGTAFSGGRGGAVKTISGVLLMYTIFNAMSMFNIYVNIQAFIKGAIMLFIIVMDKYMDNRDKKV